MQHPQLPPTGTTQATTCPQAQALGRGPWPWAIAAAVKVCRTAVCSPVDGRCANIGVCIHTASANTQLALACTTSAATCTALQHKNTSQDHLYMRTHIQRHHHIQPQPPAATPAQVATGCTAGMSHLALLLRLHAAACSYCCFHCLCCCCRCC